MCGRHDHLHSEEGKAWAQEERYDRLISWLGRVALLYGMARLIDWLIYSFIMLGWMNARAWSIDVSCYWSNNLEFCYFVFLPCWKRVLFETKKMIRKSGKFLDYKSGKRFNFESSSWAVLFTFSSIHSLLFCLLFWASFFVFQSCKASSSDNAKRSAGRTACSSTLRTTPASSSTTRARWRDPPSPGRSRRSAPKFGPVSHRTLEALHKNISPPLSMFSFQRPFQNRHFILMVLFSPAWSNFKSFRTRTLWSWELKNPRDGNAIFPFHIFSSNYAKVLKLPKTFSIHGIRKPTSRVSFHGLIDWLIDWRVQTWRHFSLGTIFGRWQYWVTNRQSSLVLYLQFPF